MLDYEPARQRYHSTPEDRRWLAYRFGYYASQLLLFVAIAYWIGPNLRLYHSPFSPTPSDFVSYTKYYVPIIAEIKAYRRDFGQLPEDDGLPPAYTPPGYEGVNGEIDGTTSITFVVGNVNVLEYEFSPAREGWIIHSPRYDGPIPAPIVRAAPKPIAIPASTPTMGISNGG